MWSLVGRRVLSATQANTRLFHTRGYTASEKPTRLLLASFMLILGTLLSENKNSAVTCHDGGVPCKSRREQLKEYLKSRPEGKAKVEELPEYTSEQVSKHNGLEGGRIWMSYGGFVYDVTDFIPLHPGGTNRISRASGQAIEPFWYLHQQHYDTNEAVNILQGLVIGRLVEQDQAAIDDQLEQLQSQLDCFRLEIDLGGERKIQELSLNDLKALPKTDRTSQVGCTQSSRPVSTSLFGGVLLKDLIDTTSLKRLIFHAMDGEVVTVETDNYDNILVSYEENGAPLTQGRGFPLRIIIPGRRVVKWVKRIEVVQ